MISIKAAINHTVGSVLLPPACAATFAFALIQEVMYEVVTFGTRLYHHVATRPRKP